MQHHKPACCSIPLKLQRALAPRARVNKQWFSIYMGILVLLFTAKLMTFNYYRSTGTGSTMFPAISLFYFLSACAILASASKKNKQILIFIFYTVVSFFMFIDYFYFRAFGHMPSIGAIKDFIGSTGNIANMKHSIGFLFIADILPIGLWMFHKTRSTLEPVKRKPKAMFHVHGVKLWALAFAVFTINQGHNPQELQNELFTHHFYNVCIGIPEDPKTEKYISHAGGELEGYTYTNCRQALDQSYQRGYRLIELDFEWTTDRQLVGLHSWDGFQNKFFGKDPHKRYSYDEFMAFKMIKGWEQLDVHRIARWLRNHPDAYIVTDVKSSNVEGLKMIRDLHPEIVRQIIPQIYFMEEYDAVKKLGYKNIIWTLYLSKNSDEEILKFTQNHPLFAVTMFKTRAKTQLPFKLKEQGVFVYTHTINDPVERDAMIKNGVDGFYTDRLIE